MAKITELPLAEVPAGSDQFPIVQGGITRRASFAAFAAGLLPILPEGFKGDPGAAGNVAAHLLQLKAAAIVNDTMLYDGTPFKWTLGDYTGDDDDVNIIESDHEPLSTGAWIRQGAASIQATGGQTVQEVLDNRPPTYATLSAFKAGSITLANGYAVYDGVTFHWETANAPYTDDDQNIIKADSTALSVGAWVRQKSQSITYARNAPGAYTRVLKDKLESDALTVFDFMSETQIAAVRAGELQTDTTDAFEDAIYEAQSLGSTLNPTLNMPAGRYRLTRTLNVTSQGMCLRGDWVNTYLVPTMSDGSACLKIAAGLNQWQLENFRIYGDIDYAGFRAGTADPQNCIGVDASDTDGPGSSVVYNSRFNMRNVWFSGVADALKINGFIVNLDNIWITQTERGLTALNMNSCDASFRFEENRKAFSITDSYAVLLRQLIHEDSLADTVASTIDGCGGLEMPALYLEGDPAHPRSEPFIRIGGSSKCYNVNITGARISASTSMANEVFPIEVDQCDGLLIGGHIQEGPQLCTIKTTANTTNYRSNLTLSNAGGALQDGSKQLGVAYNYFANRNFDVWFRGWGLVYAAGAPRAVMSQETTIIRKGANAVRITTVSGQTNNNYTWRLTGPEVIALRGKTVRLGMWMWVPNISAYEKASSSANPPMLPRIRLSPNGTGAAITDSGVALRNAWNFLTATGTIPADATQIECIASANLGGVNGTGAEYVVIDSASLCEATVPMQRHVNDDLIDHPSISQFAGGRMIAFADSAPTDPAQTYSVADIVWKGNVAAGGSPGWICTTAGVGGTAVFKAMAAVAA